MNRIVVGLIGLMLVGSTAISYADGVIIPVSINTDDFKKEMKDKGIDLYGTSESDGFIEDKGNQIKVVTYKPVTIEQMELMKEVSFRTVRQSGKHYVR